METLLAAAVISATLIAVFFVVLFVWTQGRALSTAADSSDDETASPLSVSVVSDHDEQDSLLPKFAGLLRSPWHSVTSSSSSITARSTDPPKTMRSVRKGSRSMSLTMPLPLLKKRKPAHVPVKKVHVPYFFPLLDETAEWWQEQQPTADATQQAPEQEPEAGPDNHSEEDGMPSSNKIQAAATELVHPKQSQYCAGGEMASTLIEFGGR